MVTSQSPPFMPHKANMIINAWCHSHRYGFADKVDLESGKVVEWTYGSIPKNLREIIKHTLGDFSESVDEAVDCFIETDCTDSDPEFRQAPGVPSSKLLHSFMHDKRKRVLLLLGQAGSGKSTIGMKWVIEMGEAWHADKAYPVYLYLPRCKSVKEYMKDAVGPEKSPVNDQAWRDFLRRHSFFVVMDAYDEMGTTENVVDKLFKELAVSKGIKVIVTCRSGYLKMEGKADPLFWPHGLGGREALQVAWVCPLSWNAKDQISRYIEDQVMKRSHKGLSMEQFEEALKSNPELKSIISTPYSLKVMLTVLPGLFYKRMNKPKSMITRHSMYKEYAKEWYRREWDKLKQNHKLAELAQQAEVDDGNYIRWYSRAAQQLCLHMLRQRNIIIRHKSGGIFLSEPPFNLSMRQGHVEKELGYWLLRGCLTRLKTNKLGDILEVSFVHDTVRSFSLPRIPLRSFALVWARKTISCQRV
ncbi:hypothetical protein GUITHDRAFT_110301 [Guillardia theta CCMP2712]|uniref:NACHT domain-containing protein n=1 Tax=Guillardia theta (strain CCMP2712) TaxID=905079 RepID=L1J6Z7_GUITC|nr:hypothetical protein GUITHDRAFT_110301 [Guillardia theta CCMP2712]EKX43850.1 hypothetical protein GUITHDRAFT_110301 [Guillardia theta CCMP2712]|eukprot:XP_005830830.1 hypothetical protein GUITHDRAFT_110301 [Guillardia theta CCMP2712]